MEPVRLAVQAVVEEKMQSFGSAGKAVLYPPALFMCFKPSLVTLAAIKQDY